MLRFYSTLIGENPDHVATFQPAGKRKVALYANVLFIPVMLWLLNGFLLSYQIVQAGIILSLITALVAALIVFLIERAIIMSNGSKVIMTFRLCLGFLIASIGAIAVDQALFKEDIDLKVAEYKKEFVKKLSVIELEEITTEINQLESVITTKRVEWINAQNEATGECDGTKGSKIPKRGPICDVKLAYAGRLESDYHTEVNNLDQLKLEYQTKSIKAAEEANNSFSDKGFLIRMEALASLVKEKSSVKKVFWGFTALFFLLEFMVVLIKVFSHDSVDEQLEKARDKELIVKMNTLLTRTHEYRSPQELLDQIRKSKDMLAKKDINIFN